MRIKIVFHCRGNTRFSEKLLPSINRAVFSATMNASACATSTAAFTAAAAFTANEKAETEVEEEVTYV